MSEKGLSISEIFYINEDVKIPTKNELNKRILGYTPIEEALNETEEEKFIRKIRNNKLKIQAQIDRDKKVQEVVRQLAYHNILIEEKIKIENAISDFIYTSDICKEDISKFNYQISDVVIKNNLQEMFYNNIKDEYELEYELDIDNNIIVVKFI